MCYGQSSFLEANKSFCQNKLSNEIKLHQYKQNKFPNFFSNNFFSIVVKNLKIPQQYQSEPNNNFNIRDPVSTLKKLPRHNRHERAIDR